MSALRRHLLSLTAVVLALAVGLALGGGLLGSGDASSPSSQPSSQPADARETAAPPTPSTTAPTTPTDNPAPEPPDLTVRRLARYGNDFAAGAAPRLYADALRDSAVAVVTLPGASDEVAKSLIRRARDAAADVVARYDVQGALTDPGRSDDLDSLLDQLQPDLGSRVDAKASTYVRLGELVGLAVATTRGRSAPADPTATTARSQLLDADLVRASSGRAALAPLVLVVLGRRADPSVLTGLLGGLASATRGLVVAGRTGGDLDGLRDGGATNGFSTVDSIDSALGQVTAVLAVVGQAAGVTGEYGATGADGIPSRTSG